MARRYGADAHLVRQCPYLTLSGPLSPSFLSLLSLPHDAGEGPGRPRHRGRSAQPGAPRPRRHRRGRGPLRHARRTHGYHLASLLSLSRSVSLVFCRARSSPVVLYVLTPPAPPSLSLSLLSHFSLSISHFSLSQSRASARSSPVSTAATAASTPSPAGCSGAASRGAGSGRPSSSTCSSR